MNSMKTTVDGKAARTGGKEGKEREVTKGKEGSEVLQKVERNPGDVKELQEEEKQRGNQREGV